MQIHEYLELDPETRTIECSECGERLCDADQNYKEHSVMNAMPMEEASPVFVPPEEVLPGAAEVEFRQFCCPSCAILFGTEVALADEEILHDIEIDVDRLDPE